MAFCAKCGAQLNAGSGFCAACGAAVASQSVTPSGAATAPAQSSAGAPSAGMTNNVAGCLSYLVGWVTGLIFLVIEPYKNDKFVRFHAFQSIFLSIAVFAIWIGALDSVDDSRLHYPRTWIFHHGSIDDAGLAGCCGCGCYLHDQSLWQSVFKLPFIGDMAAKQAGCVRPVSAALKARNVK